MRMRSSASYHARMPASYTSVRTSQLGSDLSMMTAPTMLLTWQEQLRVCGWAGGWVCGWMEGWVGGKGHLGK